MSSLTGTQINQTYPSLLKMETSTTGVTSTIQNLQDGLGNDTGVKIATNRFEGSNIYNILKPSTPPQYFGAGIASTNVTPVAGQQNTITTQLFYDNGVYSYSAITINCGILEAGTSVDISFYNSQLLNTYGYVPYQKMVTEVNLSTTSTGLKTATFASPLSFSATGPGIYFMVIRYNAAGAPALRLRVASSNSQTQNASLLANNYGYVFDVAGTAAASPFQTNVTTPTASLVGVNYNTGTFPTTWTSTELNLVTNITSSAIGFLLHTIR